MLTKKEAIAFIGDCIDRKLVLAILSFDVPRLIVLVKGSVFKACWLASLLQLG